jgi:hypothetical protein
MADEINEWGGCRAGKRLDDSSAFSFPLCHLQATRETLTVRIAWTKHALRKDQVSAIRRYNMRFLLFDHKLSELKVIQIVHTHPKCPPFLTFSGFFGRDATLERFKQLGYNVTEDTVTESVQDI